MDQNMKPEEEQLDYRVHNNLMPLTIIDLCMTTATAVPKIDSCFQIQ